MSTPEENIQDFILDEVTRRGGRLGDALYTPGETFVLDGVVISCHDVPGAADDCEKMGWDRSDYDDILPESEETRDHSIEIDTENLVITFTDVQNRWSFHIGARAVLEVRGDRAQPIDLFFCELSEESVDTYPDLNFWVLRRLKTADMDDDPTGLLNMPSVSRWFH